MSANRASIPGRGELLRHARYARKLRAQLREPLDPRGADQEVRAGLGSRARSFVALLRSAVYARSGSPYLRLLEHAGIEHGDIEALVADTGVEGALARLHAEGIRLSLDEFKGRTPICRGALELAVSPEDFDNPLVSRDMRGTTSGSRGAPRRVFVDLAQTRRDAAHQLRFMHVAGLLGRPSALWRPLPPALPGIGQTLRFAHFGQGMERWFTPIPFREAPIRSAGFVALTMGVLSSVGLQMRWPRHVPLADPGDVIEWIAQSVRAGRPPVLTTTPSGAVRVCQEASSEPSGIAGTVFLLGGEPFTPARAQVLEGAGCEGFATYQMAETGRIGVSCVARTEPDEVHLLEDKFAAIQRSVDTRGTRIDDVLVLTSVWPRAPKLLLNVETDDTAIVERGECGCGVGAGGFSGRARRIRSYEKLTGEGMTFTIALVVRLVEEVLPSRFGGTPADYQLVEDNSGALTRIELAVAPRLGPLDTAAISDTVYATLGEGAGGPALMARIWRDAGAVRVVRREPQVTPRGKVFPVHVITDDSHGRAPANAAA